MLVRFYDDYFPHLTFLLLFRFKNTNQKHGEGTTKTKTEDLEKSFDSIWNLRRRNSALMVLAIFVSSLLMRFLVALGNFYSEFIS